MTERSQVYKCERCGNITEVVHNGNGELVCCGVAMSLLNENTTDAATEKHIPVLEKTDSGISVQVGDVIHPMEEKHYIEWIELNTNDRTYRHYLKPHDEPKAIFNVDAKSYSVRAYCNLHGLWKKV